MADLQLQAYALNAAPRSSELVKAKNISYSTKQFEGGNCPLGKVRPFFYGYRGIVL